MTAFSTERHSAAAYLVDGPRAAELLDQGALLVDLRSDHGVVRHGSYRLTGARTVNRSVFAVADGDDATRLRDRFTGPHQTIVVFCQTEVGSSLAVSVLRDVGFTSVFHVRGGWPQLEESIASRFRRGDGSQQRLEAV